MEEWRTIPGFSNYEVSEFGRVKRVQGGKGAVVGRILRPTTASSGHLVVRLNIDNRQFPKAVHNIVFITFIGPVPKGYAVHHADTNMFNNHYSNFEIMLRGCHSSEHNKGEGNGQAKLSELDVLEIKRLLNLGGISQQEISKGYGVCQQLISDINIGRLWKHI